jgi:hypothetical protein
MKALFSGFLGPPNDSESGPRDQEMRERERDEGVTTVQKGAE